MRTECGILKTVPAFLAFSRSGAPNIPLCRGAIESPHGMVPIRLPSPADMKMGFISEALERASTGRCQTVGGTFSTEIPTVGCGCFNTPRRRQLSGPQVLTTCRHEVTDVRLVQAGCSRSSQLGWGISTWKWASLFPDFHSGLTENWCLLSIAHYFSGTYVFKHGVLFLRFLIFCLLINYFFIEGHLIYSVVFISAVTQQVIPARSVP